MVIIFVPHGPACVWYFVYLMVQQVSGRYLSASWSNLSQVSGQVTLFLRIRTTPVAVTVTEVIKGRFKTILIMIFSAKMCGYQSICSEQWLRKQKLPGKHGLRWGKMWISDVFKIYFYLSLILCKSSKKV